MTERKKTALITGASSGIGVELARLHARRGGDLVLVARRQDRLEAIKAELESAHGVKVHVIVRDLARADAAAQIHRELIARNVPIDYLINNAGFGNGGHDGSERSTEKAAPHDSAQRASADVASCCSASAPRR